MLRYSLLDMMDCLAFDKVRVKGEVLKAVRKLLVRRLSWSLGLTDMQGNVLRNGRSESTKPLVVRTCVNIVSVGTLCVKTRHSFKGSANECKTPEKCKLWVLHANRCPRQMWDWTEHWPFMVVFLTTYYILPVPITSHLFSPHTIIRNTEENPNRVMTGKFFVLAS